MNKPESWKLHYAAGILLGANTFRDCSGTNIEALLEVEAWLLEEAKDEKE